MSVYGDTDGPEITVQMPFVHRRKKRTERGRARDRVGFYFLVCVVLCVVSLFVSFGVVCVSLTVSMFL